MKMLFYHYPRTQITILGSLLCSISILTCGDVLEGSAVAAVVELVAEVGAARVVARPRAAVLTSALLAPAHHRLRVAGEQKHLAFRYFANH